MSMSISPGQNPSSFKALEATSAILPSLVVTCLLSCIPGACLLPAVLTCFLTLSLLISDQPYLPGSTPFTQLQAQEPLCTPLPYTISCLMVGILFLNLSNLVIFEGCGVWTTFLWRPG